MVLNEDGATHLFRVYLPEARAVELVGTFTDWRARPIAMLPEPANGESRGGWWSARVEMNPGDHLFSYLVDHSAWLADYAATGVKGNGYGGWVSQLHVPATIHTRPALALAA
jgi:1,4-alpha-glucan branching enzyme